MFFSPLALYPGYFDWEERLHLSAAQPVEGVRLEINPPLVGDKACDFAEKRFLVDERLEALQRLLRVPRFEEHPF